MYVCTLISLFFGIELVNIAHVQRVLQRHLSFSSISELCKLSAVSLYLHEEVSHGVKHNRQCFV
jgi:hypothetical protein